MQRKALAAVLIVFGMAAAATPASASVPLGQQGYEGQPGNQGGFQQAGQQGYEGQPGNQAP